MEDQDLRNEEVNWLTRQPGDPVPEEEIEAIEVFDWNEAIWGEN